MPYIFVMGSCIACGQPFFFNPDRVPSIVLNGQREPVCRDCVERANPLRKTKGLEAIRILRGAYQRQEVA